MSFEVEISVFTRTEYLSRVDCIRLLCSLLHNAIQTWCFVADAKFRSRVCPEGAAVPEHRIGF
jgi:hypothetical protein